MLEHEKENEEVLLKILVKNFTRNWFRRAIEGEERSNLILIIILFSAEKNLEMNIFSAQSFTFSAVSAHEGSLFCIEHEKNSWKI